MVGWMPRALACRLLPVLALACNPGADDVTDAGTSGSTGGGSGVTDPTETNPTASASTDTSGETGATTGDEYVASAASQMA